MSFDYSGQMVRQGAEAAARETSPESGPAAPAHREAAGSSTEPPPKAQHQLKREAGKEPPSRDQIKGAADLE